MLLIWMNLFLLTADLAKVKEADLDRLRALGAQGFELPGTVSTPADCERLGRYLKAHGLRSALNVAVDEKRDPSSPDAKVRAQGIKYLESRIDCAAALGAETLAGPIALPWGGFPAYRGDELEARYLKPHRAFAAASLRALAAYAEARGVKLALEPLTHWEMTGLNTMRETIAFVKQVNHPNFGVTVDSSHEVLDGEGPKVFAAQMTELARLKKIFYVQVSPASRGDLEFGWMPWREFVGAVKPHYSGPVAIEMMNNVPPFDSGLRLSRPDFKDPFDVARRAITVTRANWEAR